MYLWVHSEEGVGASATQGGSLEGLAVVKMVVIVQVSDLQNKKQVTFLQYCLKDSFKSSPSHDGLSLPEAHLASSGNVLPTQLPTCVSGTKSVFTNRKFFSDKQP